jgi:hypothetical protein
MLTIAIIASVIGLFALSGLIGGAQRAEDHDGYVEFAQTPYTERAKTLTNA